MARDLRPGSVTKKKYAHFNKGDREKGSPKGPCFRCGGKHWARDCPDKSDKRLKPPRQAHFVLMANREDEPPAADPEPDDTDSELSFETALDWNTTDSELSVETAREDEPPAAEQFF